MPGVFRHKRGKKMITVTTICPKCGEIGYSYDDRKNKGWLCPSCGFAGVKVAQVKA
jgi:predicted RNA-binding Zn-ribbon protein involved in translation (DUF1610 family)